MGSDWGELWRRILRFSWFGHQSLFDLIPVFVVPCTIGHLPAFSSVFASMFPSDRVPVFFEGLLEAPGMQLPGLGERLEPVGDLVEAFLAGHARHARIHVGVFVGLARDRGLEVVAGRTDRLAGRQVAHFLEIFEMAVRVPGLALGSRAERGGDIVEALDVGLLGEIEIAAARLALAGESFLQILLGLGSLERRHVPFPAWSEKPMTRGCARRTRESMKFRNFLVCGGRRVPSLSARSAHVQAPEVRLAEAEPLDEGPRAPEARLAEAEPLDEGPRAPEARLAEAEPLDEGPRAPEAQLAEAVEPSRAPRVDRRGGHHARAIVRHPNGGRHASPIHPRSPDLVRNSGSHRSDNHRLDSHSSDSRR